MQCKAGKSKQPTPAVAAPLKYQSREFCANIPHQCPSDCQFMWSRLMVYAVMSRLVRELDCQRNHWMHLITSAWVLVPRPSGPPKNMESPIRIEQDSELIMNDIQCELVRFVM